MDIILKKHKLNAAVLDVAAFLTVRVASLALDFQANMKDLIYFHFTRALDRLKDRHNEYHRCSAVSFTQKLAVNDILYLFFLAHWFVYDTMFHSITDRC